MVTAIRKALRSYPGVVLSVVVLGALLVRWCVLPVTVNLMVPVMGKTAFVQARLYRWQVERSLYDELTVRVNQLLAVIDDTNPLSQISRYRLGTLDLTASDPALQCVIDSQCDVDAMVANRLSKALEDYGVTWYRIRLGKFTLNQGEKND